MTPLKFVTISELKSGAKQILEEVSRTGKRVTVTVNGKPIAIISLAREEGFSYVEKKEPTRKSK